MLELLIYAAIAVLVISQLFRVLGRTDGHNPTEKKQNPPPSPKKSEDRDSLKDQWKKGAGSNSQNYLTERFPGEAQILQHLPEFEQGKFLQGASAAYRIIIEAFGRRDRETLKDLVSDHVLSLWDDALEEPAGVIKVERVQHMEMLRGDIAYGQARIDLRFQAVVDSDGEKSEMEEIWSFTKDIRSADPNWILANVTSVDSDEEA